jgi:hypothetical protein
MTGKLNRGDGNTRRAAPMTPPAGDADVDAEVINLSHACH